MSRDQPPKIRLIRGEAEADDDEGHACGSPVGSVGHECADEQCRPQLDGSAQTCQSSGDPGLAPGREERTAGEYRRQHVEAQVRQRTDQRYEDQPEVDRSVVTSARRAPECIGEQSIEGQHEDHKCDEIADAAAKGGAVGQPEDPDHRRGVLEECAVQASSEQRVDLAVVIEDVAHHKALKGREHEQDQQASG